MTTPCERLGYEEGMKFIVVNDDIDGLTAGDSVWLHADDGSSNPEFRDTEKLNDDTETYYIDLSYVARYHEDHTLAYMRGLRKGDILQMVMDDNGEDAYEGDIITFIKDDGDTCPQFEVQKDGNKAYLYLSHVGGLKPKVGRKVRVIHNCTAGFSAGTEGIIDEICSDGDFHITANGKGMYHHADSCLVFGYAENESSDSKDSEPVKEDYPTKPASEWKQGDRGIVRGQQENDLHNFQIGEEITFERVRDSERGIFRGTKYTSTQNIQYDLIEVIQTSKLVEVKESLSELQSTSKKYKYFIDGDSIEVTLVGYFDGEPICAYKDRWGDIQTFVAKPSLLVEE